MRKGSFWRPNVPDEVKAELDFHLEARTRDLMAQGLDRETAEREAARRLGDVSALADRLRTLGNGREATARRREHWAELRGDVVLAWRGLRATPLATAAVIASLALGIGGVVAGFSVLHGVLTKPLPYPDEQRLVAVSELAPGSSESFDLSYPTWRDLSRLVPSFARTAGYWSHRRIYREGEDTPEVPTASVTGDFFATMGQGAAVGRGLVPADDSAGANVAVVSDRFWRMRLGRRVDVVNTTIVLDGTSYLVVGVLPPSFRFPTDETDIWTPFGPPESWMENRTVHILSVVARLRPPATLVNAVAESRVATARLTADHPGGDPRHQLLVRGLRSVLVGDARPLVLVIFAGVSALLLLACGNVTALVLSRAAGRQGEMAVRTALGAGRGRLARQVLTETSVVAGIAGLAGMGCAVLGIGWLVGHLPEVPRLAEVGVSPVVIGFAWLLTALVGLGLGLAPVWLSTETDGRAVLGTVARRVTAGIGHRRLLRTVVVIQLGLTGALLVTGVAVARSFERITRVDPGFRPEGLLLAGVSVPATLDREATIGFYRDLPGRLTAIPGITAASATSVPPLNGGDGYGEVTALGQAWTPGEAPIASFRRVLPNYFRTLGIPLVEGREFTDDDRGGREMTVIVSQSMARRLWPSGGAIGRRIKIGPPESEPWLTVIGVVGDVRNVGLDAPAQFATYEPHAQRPRSTMTVVVRAAGDASGLARPVSRAIREPNRSVSVFRTITMRDQVGAALGPRRFHVAVLGFFAVVALGLALVGVVGLTQFTAAARRREFGVRTALGATPGSLVRMGLGESAVLTGAGLAVGLALAIAGGRLTSRLLVETSATDPALLAAVGAGLATLALLAAFLPYHRVSRAAPMAALREE
jgi:predicted permease